MKVARNTYPVYPNVAHAEIGDEVSWQTFRGHMFLVRKSDGKTVFSRDCLPRHMEDTRPMVGVIVCVANRGWYLEVTT